MVGIIYNTTMVDEKDTGDWSLMFDKALMEKYSGKILQFNNLRDAFGTAMFHAGVSVNTTDMNEWQTSLELLKAQKPYVQSYVMDEIFNKMKGESAAIAPYYAGDFLSMYEDNDNLAFYYPESGTNIFVDAMCIPNTSKNQDAAAIYINFMLEEEIAKANAEYIYYASPHKLVRENEEYIEYMCSIHEDAMEILYPEHEMKTEFYHVLDDDTQRAANGLWEQLKIENTMGYGIYIVTVVIVLIVAAFFAFIGIRKKKRSKYY
jgi:spermidine/putrescine transport system substrate-binding protein